MPTIKERGRLLVVADVTGDSGAVTCVVLLPVVRAPAACAIVEVGDGAAEGVGAVVGVGTVVVGADSVVVVVGARVVVVAGTVVVVVGSVVAPAAARRVER